MRRFSYLIVTLFFVLPVNLYGNYKVESEDKNIESVELDSDGISDPFEGFNRAMFNFNMVLDKLIFSPLSRLYSFAPNFARKGVRNFLINLRSPVTFFNDIFQLELKKAGQTFVRTFVNTTFGIGGLFDIASGMGLDYHSEDFDQTLAVVGIGNGPYLVLPILGPTTPRDLVGRGVDAFLNPINYYWADQDMIYMSFVTYGVEMLDRRTEARPFMEELDKAIDPYARIRSLYMQSRQYHTNNEKLEEEEDTPRPID